MDTMLLIELVDLGMRLLHDDLGQELVLVELEEQPVQSAVEEALGALLEKESLCTVS